MPRTSALYLCLAVGLLVLVGCAPAAVYTSGLYSFAEPPPDYSPDYTYVPVIATDRPCCVQRWVLVPQACLTADPTEPLGLGPHLPPGCANAHNLLRMAERKRDLLEGRRLGAAPAAPSARAAQQYIYGGSGSNIHGASGPLGGGLAVPGGPQPPQGDTEKEKPASVGSLQQYDIEQPERKAMGSISRR